MDSPQLETPVLSNDPYDNNNPVKHNLSLIKPLLEPLRDRVMNQHIAMESLQDEINLATQQIVQLSDSYSAMSTDHKDGDISDKEFNDFVEKFDAVKLKHRNLLAEREGRPAKYKKIKAELSRLESRQKTLKFSLVPDFVGDRKLNLIEEVLPVIGEIVALATLESNGQQADFLTVLSVAADRHCVTSYTQALRDGNAKVAMEFDEYQTSTKGENSNDA